MWWVHSIMPNKSGRTNRWVFDSHRLSTKTFGHSISWLLLSTQFCCFYIVFTDAALLLLVNKGLVVPLHCLNRIWPKGIAANVCVLILTAGPCNVDRSWCYPALEGAPLGMTEGWNWALLQELCIFCSLLPPLERKQQCGWGNTGPAPLYFQLRASAN